MAAWHKSADRGGLVQDIEELGTAMTCMFSALMLICMAAWMTHVVNCVRHGANGFLIGGAVAFPVAIVHGIGLWLGVW